MEPLQIGKIRVHLKDGTSYDCPEGNKANVVRCIPNIARIAHYKLPKPALPPKDIPVVVVTPKAPKKRKKRNKK